MNETLRTIHSLRSIHGNFSDKAIADSDLQTILDASVRAATASARQSYSIIVVSDKADMREHLQYVGDKALIFCVDYTRLVDTAEHLDLTFECDDLLNFITGSSDTILAAQTAAIAAKSLGIDSLFTNSVTRGDLSKLYTKFNLPAKHCFPLIALILGYYDGNQPIKGRATGAGIVHYDRYQNQTQEDIKGALIDYSCSANNLGLDLFKKSDYHNYWEWFFKEWCNPQISAMLRGIQPQLYQTLIRAGFIDKNLVK